MTRRAVFVTRPGEPGRLLTQDLIAAGLPAIWLPAFTLGPPPDPQAVSATLARLDQYQLAIFVSAAAAEATAQALPGVWPAATAIGAVGEATRRAVLEHIPSSAAATWFSPDAGDAGRGGSEALWRVLGASLGGIRRALILRAAHGREWLAGQLTAAGVAVDNLAVYSRDAAPQPALTGADLAQPLLVMTSSEAVDTVLAQLDADGGLGLRERARVIAPHERIVARARAAGFADVRLVPLEIDAIRQAALAQ